MILLAGRLVWLFGGGVWLLSAIISIAQIIIIGDFESMPLGLSMKFVSCLTVALLSYREAMVRSDNRDIR